jgi:hypothetical protein
MPLSEKFQQVVRKHPFKWAFAGFVVITLPQWLSGTWALFSSVPLFQWLRQNGIRMPTFSFSLSWITFPVGFVFLAYIAWQSILQRRELKKSLSSAINVKPLHITALPPEKVQIEGGFWRSGIHVEICNPNQSVSGVKLKITKVEPIFGIQHGASLDAIEFPLIGFSDRVLHKNQKCRVLLFTAEYPGQVNLHFWSSDKEKWTLAVPQKENGNPVEHILTLETSAVGVDPASQQFRLLYKMTDAESPVTLEEVSEHAIQRNLS